MRNTRYIYFFLSIILGVGLGLLYGWVISPVELVDTTPATLRMDYKTDYVLMVAEVYALEQEPGEVVCRLAVLGGNPLLAVQEAKVFAVEVGYTPDDLVLIDEIEALLLAWQPGQEDCE